MFRYWNVTSLLNGKKGYDFQIILKEGSTDILFNYEEVYSGGPDTVMVGIENQDGSIGLRYPGFDKLGTYSKRSVRFYMDDAPAPIYYDRDNDGYTSDVDCNDYNSSIHPGAKEICGDGIDNDCDGSIDEGCAATVVDADLDGYGRDVDCNDYNAAIHPGAVEICDGFDNDCDGIVDEGCSDAVDNDGDGYNSDNDCDDEKASIHPGAVEICDGFDNDCDGFIDEGCGSSGENSGGPDSFGYRYITSDEPGGPEYKWENFSEKSQRLMFNADDGLKNAIPMGFFYDPGTEFTPYFEFYGKLYNNVYIAGNGYLTFTPDSKYTNFAYEGQGFAVASEPNNLVAPLWLGEQSPEDAGAMVEVIYETLGVEPQRRFVMQFKRNTAAGQQIAYQVVFFEKENTIQVNYQSIASLGADFKIAGIENRDGSIGLRYTALDEATNITERSVLFYVGDPPVNPELDHDPDSPPVAGRANLYMPLVMSGNWQTSVTLLNDSGSETVTGVLQGHDSKGNVLVSSESVILAPLARQDGTLEDYFGEFDGELAYLTFVGNLDAVVGSVHLQVAGQSLVGAYPALSHAATSDTLFLPMVITQSDWGNIVSLVNADSKSCYATIEFDNGATKSLFFEPGQQIFLYPLADITVLSADRKQVLLKNTTPEPRGAVINGGDGMLGAVLYYHGETACAAALDGDIGKQVIYPYLPDSSAWWGGLTLFNPQSALIDTTLTGYLADGEPADLSLTDVTLGFMESRRFQSANLLPGDSGWMQVESASSIAGMEFFGTIDGKQMAAISTGRLSGSSGVFSDINIAQAGLWSGVVLFNPGVVDNQIALIAYDDNGRVLGETRKIIPAYGQIVSEAANLFAPASIDQATSIRFAAESELVGILFNGSNYKVSGYPLGELEALPSLRLATTGDRY